MIDELTEESDIPMPGPVRPRGVSAWFEVFDEVTTADQIRVANEANRALVEELRRLSQEMDRMNREGWRPGPPPTDGELTPGAQVALDQLRIAQRESEAIPRPRRRPRLHRGAF